MGSGLQRFGTLKKGPSVAGSVLYEVLLKVTLPIVSIVVPFLVNQNLYYRILIIKLVNRKRELNPYYRILIIKLVNRKKELQWRL